MKAIFEVYNPIFSYWYTVDMETYYFFTEVLRYPGRCDRGLPEPDDLITSSGDHSSPAEGMPPA